jgi:hypothetical protein
VSFVLAVTKSLALANTPIHHEIRTLQIREVFYSTGPWFTCLYSVICFKFIEIKQDSLLLYHVKIF